MSLPPSTPFNLLMTLIFDKIVIMTKLLVTTIWHIGRVDYFDIFSGLSECRNFIVYFCSIYIGYIPCSIAERKRSVKILRYCCGAMARSVSDTLCLFEGMYNLIVTTKPRLCPLTFSYYISKLYSISETACLP